MNSEQIREEFLSYFESKSHLRIQSGSLIPVGDPTLLLTSAGMVQFKPYFIGEQTPPNKRLTSSQKSFRTVDIEEVGDNTHLTLFEMLGNFSIGDYFKEGAVEFALGCLNDAYGITKEKLVATVHHSDEEARKLWQAAGIPLERIFEFGDEDNWWGPAGLEGPCGPCSELHYDFGKQHGCQKSNCGPNCSNYDENQKMTCTRFVELWNLVFMQFYHHLDGSRTDLPAPSVDTGMGLERLAVILQKTKNIYETDLFVPIINRVSELTGIVYGDDEKETYAMRVLAEHSRSATFLIADGVVPGNEGRGYVLRRVLRRAIRYGINLGLKDSFLSDIAEEVVNKMKPAYPELAIHADFVFSVIKLEEQNFQRTYLAGYSVLNDSLKANETLSGDVVFKLWDTYGFPVEITQEIAEERNIEVDIDGFNKSMQLQKEKGRSSAKFGGDRFKIKVYESLGVNATKFLGYETLKTSSVIVGIIADDVAVESASEGTSVELFFLDTPFYPEGGGQVGDAGEINTKSCIVEINDTQTVIPGLISHFGTVSKGEITLGETVDASVNPIRRQDNARNHTATHMLHSALRVILGSHVRQAGSLVAPDRLRFDFSHVSQMTDDEINQVQALVNEKIRQNARVMKSTDKYTDAVKNGALAFFGDKYDDEVRLVEIANGDRFSYEVCGGTHVSNTGEVGSVFITNESSIGSGMRRIEAVSGRRAEQLIAETFKRQKDLARLLQIPEQDLSNKIQSVLQELEDLKKSHGELQGKLSITSAESLLDEIKDLDGVPHIGGILEVTDSDQLREIGDWLRDKMGRGIVALGAILNDRPSLVVMISSDLVKEGFDAGSIARSAAKLMDGGGGGGAATAQAGGKNPDALKSAIDEIPKLIIETKRK